MAKSGLHRCGLVAVAITSFVALATSVKADSDFAPLINPTYTATRTNEHVEIDGKLDDPVWRSMRRSGGFTQYQPEDMVAPLVQTEFMIAYDEHNLYVAVIAYDDNPNALRASLRDRDEIYQDDYVSFILDPFGNGAWYYELLVNPLGVQGDLRWSNGFGEDSNFDLVWRSDATITDQGYQYEMAIPFRSLRFPLATVHSWRMQFWRHHPRDRRRDYTWGAVDLDNPCFPCQFGTLTGITGIEPGNPIELLPSVVGSQASAYEDDPVNGLEHGDPDGDVSLGLKYSITSSLTAEGTINPDFSQIESDAGQIDVNTTFALFFPEQRPFFQEGSDLFSTWVNAVYTRSINDPIFATKLVGRAGKTSVGYLAARDDHTGIFIPGEEGSEFLETGKSVSNIARIKHSVRDDSYIGALATDRRHEDGSSNTVLGTDGIYQFFRNYRFETQTLLSFTERESGETSDEDLAAKIGEHSFWGHAVYASFERSGRNWNFDFDYWENSPGFRADNGFETRNHFRDIEGWMGYQFRPNGRVFQDIEFSASSGRIWNTIGVIKDSWVRPELWLNLRGQTSVSIARLYSAERFNDVVFDDIRVWDFNVNSRFSDLIQPSFGVSPVRIIARNLETPVMGEGVIFNGSVRLKPMDRFFLIPSWRYQHLDHENNGPRIFRAYILRLRSTYQFTRGLFVRVILEYADFRENDEVDPNDYERSQNLSVEPLVTYRVNPFTTFYIGSTHSYEDLDPHGLTDLTQTSRQFFFKIQYLIMR